MRPELADPDQRAAYKKELRAIAPLPRITGFVLIVLGVAGLFYTQFRATGEHDMRLASWLLIAAGWVLWVFVIVTRTRHHRRRMAGS